MTCILDASAIIALLRDESGADAVEKRLLEESDGPGPAALISTVNLSEVIQHHGEAAAALIVTGRDGPGAIAVPEPFTGEDALIAAELHEGTRGAGLSLADRACLALGRRTGLEVMTADRAWARLDVGVTIVVIR